MELQCIGKECEYYRIPLWDETSYECELSNQVFGIESSNNVICCISEYCGYYHAKLDRMYATKQLIMDKNKGGK